MYTGIHLLLIRNRGVLPVANIIAVVVHILNTTIQIYHCIVSAFLASFFVRLGCMPVLARQSICG
jgi:hypothetical protein